MYSRPKQTDSEQEILEMQKKFFEEKANKGNAFQPAAQVVKIQKSSLFAQSRQDKEKPVETKKEEHSTVFLFGDIVEKKPQKPEDKILTSEILDQNSGFPRAEKLPSYNSVSGKSLFALSMERKRHKIEKPINTSMPPMKSVKFSFSDSCSKLIEDTETAQKIHEENLQTLNQMTHEEILAEREKLLQSLDPQLIKFVQSKQTKKIKPVESNDVPMKETEVINKEIESTVNDIKSVANILEQSDKENWLNFNVIEKEKLEWMKDIPNKIASLKPGETFEARFDWKGVLLPFTEIDDDKDHRDLYLHGDQDFRPGYTLQELFRLARSNVIQQRISAFNAISGILNIYNQGFYDNVLELPITKIFFLLRFGFDENSLGILEVVANGLSTLFYNSTDENVLDLINETREGFLQPLLDIAGEKEKYAEIDESSEDEDLQKKLKKLNLESSPFSASIQEDESENKTSMNDYQLAETDLIECLIRTNIVQRIYYILEFIQPENTTVISCFKILIRIARTNKNSAMKISSNDDLMRTIFKRFLPGLEKSDLSLNQKIYSFPQHLALKLLRILLSQNISICIQLVSMDLIDRLKNYLHTRDDIRSEIIKVQIESLRLVRSIMCLKFESTFYKSLLPAFRYMLEWHYQHNVITMGGSYLIRQHAAALFYAIASGNFRDARPMLLESIKICCCKWFYEMKEQGIQEFSQSILLSSCLNCVSWCTESGDTTFYEFIEKYLKVFIESKMFLQFAQNLSVSSIILKKAKDRRYAHETLPNLGAVLMESDSPQLIISQLYPVYFLNNLFKLIELLKKQNYDNYLISSLIQVNLIETFTSYLKKISTYVNKKVASNYLSKPELHLIHKLICFDGFCEVITKEELLQASFNLLICMSSEFIQEIENIFDTIIFNGKYLNFDLSTLQNWKLIYLETFIYPHRVVIPMSEISLTIPCYLQPILPTDWPYLLLKSLLNKYLNPIVDKPSDSEEEFPQKEVVKITFTFTHMLEENGLKITSPTEKLMYFMIAFMGTELVFLEPELKSFLRTHIRRFYDLHSNYNFKFDGEYEGKSKFENLYVLFLDHFQSASYGDSLFSSLVIIPLAQKYDSKWRKMIWSEHAAVLRFLNCEEYELLGMLSDYLEPVETDLSLLKCYTRALSSNLLRKNSIPHKIATHHVNCHQKTTSETTELSYK